MSLQLWLPLNGDLTNNGLMDVDATPTRLTYVEDGKIGKCARFNNNTYIDLGTVTIGKEFSICGWFNIVTHNVSWATCVELYYDDTNIIKFCSLYNTTQNFTSFNILKNNVYAFDKYQFPFTLNQWNYFCVTVKDKKVVMYINGQISYQGDMTDTPLYGKYKLRIGNRFTGSYYPDFKLNDFRVYDHCLSPKEVKEISKGLMLHYPLDNNGMCCKNYIKDSIYVKPSLCNWSGGTYSRATIELDEENFTGTFWKITRGSTGSGDFRLGWSESSIPIPHTTYNDKRVTFSVWVKSTTGTTFGINLGRYSDLDITGIGTFTISANKWTKVTAGKTFSSTSANATADALELYFSLTYNTDIVMAQAKLEIADEATPWCPNEADELYSQLGMDENIEYDTSGYGNNGKIEESSAPEVVGASARGRACYHFKDLQRLELSNIAYENMSKGTVSFWIKFNEKFLNWSHYLMVANGFNWTGLDKDFIIVANQANVTSSVTSTSINIATCSYTTRFTASINTWYHIAIEWDAENYVIKKYLNGSLLATNDDSSNKRLDTYRDNYYYHHIGNADLNSTFNGDFNISDFRIYATCLSDSDIQELYNKPISIDNQGTMFAVEAIEEPASPVKFNKTGVVEANQIGEYSHNYFDYNGSMNTGIQKNVDVEKLIENNGLKLTCNSAVTTHMIIYRMQQLMFNGASGDFRVEFDGWATNPVDIRFDICDKLVATHSFDSTKQHFLGFAYSVNQYNTSSAYNGFFDIEASSIPLGTEIYITNIVITKNTPKSIGSNYIIMDDIIEN